MTDMVVGFAGGVIVGVVMGALIAHVRSARAKTQLEVALARASAEREAADQLTAEKLHLLNEARAKFEETFKSLAGDSLKENRESFMGLAKSQLETVMTQAGGNVERQREAIEKLLRPMSETLSRYEAELRKIEKARTEAYGGLRNQISSAVQSQQELRRETANLTNALKLPQVRGRWGELTLRRCAELAGMSAHCDFSEQVSVSESGQRPDMVVHLPGGREVIVDSKVSLTAYMEAIGASSDEDRERHLTDHGKQVRAHMRRLSGKGYARQFENAPDFTVLFLPGEAFFSTAVEHDPALIEDGMNNDVIIATPTTFVALLRVVERGWRQAQLEENALRICEAGRTLYDRVNVLFEHFDKIGNSLRQTVDHYNDAASSLNVRFLPQARRFKELGATAAADIADVKAVDSEPHAPRPPDPEPAQGENEAG